MPCSSATRNANSAQGSEQVTLRTTRRSRSLSAKTARELRFDDPRPGFDPPALRSSACRLSPSGAAEIVNLVVIKFIGLEIA
jgi:hypothetical protein